MPHFIEPRHENTDAQTLARGLGWFSIALGLAELAKPRAIRDGTGAPASSGLVRAFGWREIGTGAAILASRRPVAMVWGRVAGDLADLAVLAPTLRHDNPHRTVGLGAFAMVAAITALDLCVALQGDETA
ncbi:hypothetical protein [Aureimonas phyllosphaerae]|uniref:DUF4267 domain-containing protein n=1 Tax=Aureimonas phyllosphaerae TaxID=1166078 RepID=A0A7W6BW14_9HYPH|nr:hypothetical protein [Aureimonas phyllosphaerae]MBB3936148.1 hypothetical protein [Aureimonas phyllosphaerae]MBB3960127.1 hypothetical protein [Aureimonas phyllosphaerae]SFF33549.1 hypothetical protein SAMN05216566_108110 [Aureimonas phyllosphaerae]